MLKLANKSVLLSSAILCSVMVFAGCQATKPTAQTTDKPATTEQKTTAPQTTSSPKEVKTEVAGGDVTGVAECDEYIKKYESCLMSKVPEAGRTGLKASLDQSRQAWKQAASTLQGKQSLVAVCKQATDAAKQATAAYGCEW